MSGDTNAHEAPIGPQGLGEQRLQAMREAEHAAFMRTTKTQADMHEAQLEAAVSMARLMDRTEQFMAGGVPPGVDGGTDFTNMEEVRERGEAEKRWRALEVISTLYAGGDGFSRDALRTMVQDVVSLAEKGYYPDEPIRQRRTVKVADAGEELK